MAILHYTIGLPPVRHGGSVQYAADLAFEQSRQGQDVLVLTCGDTLMLRGESKVKTVGITNGVRIFKLTNPLTPTLIYGVSDPDLQHRNVPFDADNIRNFIQRNKIKVMHLHTLQGIHKSIVEYIKSLGVTIVYTTHDFHGVCPHYNLLNYNGQLCERAVASECAKCNLDEPSDKFLRVANSSFYHFLKKIGVVNILNKLRPSQQNASKKIQGESPIELDSETISRFDSLLGYYKDFFRIIDKFHFNSSQTKEVFKHFIPFAKGEVINVITSGIKDSRKLIDEEAILKFGFVGNLDDYKGFPILKKVFTEFKEEGIENIRLYVYGGGMTGIDSDCGNIEYKPPYKYDELSSILYHLDGTIVPSRWYETFSLVTLESLAHGRPAIVSDHVGAKDIVARYDKKFIFSTPGKLKELLKNIVFNPEILRQYSRKICDSPWDYTIGNHVRQIIKFYNAK